MPAPLFDGWLNRSEDQASDNEAVMVGFALVLLALSAVILTGGLVSPQSDQAQLQTEALLFAKYARAVQEYVEANPGITGTVGVSDLRGADLLPDSAPGKFWERGDWSNHVTADGAFLVFADLPAGAVGHLVTEVGRTEGRKDFGRADADNLVNPMHGVVGQFNDEYATRPGNLDDGDVVYVGFAKRSPAET